MNKILVAVVFISSLLGCSEPITHLQPLDDNDVSLAFGDSLTYGTGADHQTESYPAVLETMTGIKVINAGIPGETSEGGLARLPSLLEEHRLNLVIICHGGNDFLQRLNKNNLKVNLQQMIELVKESGAKSILIAVPTLGFGLKPEPLYIELAEVNQLPIERNSLSELLERTELKSDQVHLNAEGYSNFAGRVFSLLEISKAVE
jgi:lysophospholipase L1-like esterase